MFVPASCTGELQPLDVCGNRMVKDGLRKQFVSWYADKIQTQAVTSSATVVDFSLGRVKDLHANWVMQALKEATRPEELRKGWKGILNLSFEPLENPYSIARDVRDAGSSAYSQRLPPVVVPDL